MTRFGLRGRGRFAEGASGSLGTFAGGFTPSVLAILRIILFMGLGFVAGAAGLGRTLIILGIANLISILTSISLATIETNLHVKGGGDYYLISRTLGVEFGGRSASSSSPPSRSPSPSIRSVSAMPWRRSRAAAPWLAQAVAAGAVMGLFGLAFVGADAATRFQYVVMAILASALTRCS